MNVFDFTFEPIEEHTRRRFVERLGETNQFKDYLKNNYSEEEYDRLKEAKEEVIHHEKFGEYILQDVKKGHVVKSFGSSNTYAVFSKDKVYIIKKNPVGHWKVKTVLTAQMGYQSGHLRIEDQEILL